MAKSGCGCCSTAVCEKAEPLIRINESRVGGGAAAVFLTDSVTNDSATAMLTIPITPPTPYVDTVPATTGTTATIALGSSVDVIIETLGDHDWYSVSLTAGQTYIFTSQSISGSNPDTFLNLRNSTGTVVASDDDGGDTTYSLIAYTATATGTFYIDAGTFSDGSTGSYHLSAIAVPAVGADSVLATTATAATLAVTGAIAGNIEAASDHDWYRITLTAGETYVFRTGGVVADGTVDTTLTLRNAAGTQLVTNDDAGEGAYSAVRFTATTSGTYYLDVGAFGSTTGQYTLTAFTTPPLTVYTNDQIANQLTNGYWGGSSHHFNVAPGGTISFNVTGLTAAGQTLAREAFNLWTDVTGIIFSEITTAAQITLDDTQTGAFANSNFSNGITTSGTVNVGTDWLTSYGTNLNSYSFQTYIHEIGHVLGLGHGGNYNGSASYATDALYANDSWVTTIMSYFDPNPENTYFATLGFTRQFSVTPMVADGIATTALYGTNTLTRIGNTTYGFNNTSGRAVYDATANPNVAYTIYDSGGIDTLDYSGFSQNQDINLNAETFSSVGSRVGNVSIARGVVIENAIGGSGNDRITGNSADNALTGGLGNDLLYGNDGNDTLDGGSGVNELYGGIGNDRLVFSVGGSGTTVDGGSGTDTLVIAAATSLGGVGSGFTSIEAIEFQNNATLTLSASAAASGLAANTALSGTGKLTVTFGAGDSQLDMSQWVIAGGSNVTIAVNAGTGNDVVTAAAGGGTIDLSQGGNDTALGGSSNDSFFFGAAFNASDRVDGGAGANDQIGLRGDYTGANALTLSGANITGVETVTLLAGFDYTVTALDTLLTTGQRMTIFGSGLGVGDNLTFNGSAETTGSFLVYGGLGTDLLTGGGGADGFQFAAGRFDTATDIINGGAGNDQVALNAFSGTISGTNLISVETVVLLSGSNSIVLADDWTPSGQTRTVFGTALTLGATVNGAAETNGRLALYGGSGADTLTGGALADQIFGGNGADTIRGGLGGDFLRGDGGADTFVLGSAADSTSINYDTLVGFDASVDRIDLPGSITAIEAAITTGTLSNASFDSNLTAALAGLGANHAVTFTADQGDLAGRIFLIADTNGIAGYQAGQDAVFQLQSPVQPITDIGVFI